mmetsp:Transcript_28926/g.43684  ORF Transcript_28926/g.43684 Transcript_28926/m.43684 type:complete len:666 (+) Transcript_28926:162-2159(+)|eukprot:CAMPEP_0178903584 /NCGR_PEP_ID=MMETSP0786-20121207/5235_1 /TAXON_ID=186022 /ORGANISM="Thalassionema frauenfeldii, Strain CCMP 1798" /LENGTH=665 /DNA_ID=CAMNT_0020574965 /DNA_START=93 /DNA_END=2090 /DNA_ORIENTATION=-
MKSNIAFDHGGILQDDDFPLGRSNSDHPGRLLLKKLINDRVEEYEPADQKSVREYKGRTLRSRQDIITEVVQIMKKRRGFVKEKHEHGYWVRVPDFEDRLRKRVSNDFLSCIRKLSRNRANGEDPVIDDSQIRNPQKNKDFMTSNGNVHYGQAVNNRIDSLLLSAEKQLVQVPYNEQSSNTHSSSPWTKFTTLHSQQRKREVSSTLDSDTTTRKHLKIDLVQSHCSENGQNKEEEKSDGVSSFLEFVKISNNQGTSRGLNGIEVNTSADPRTKHSTEVVNDSTQNCQSHYADDQATSENHIYPTMLSATAMEQMKAHWTNAEIQKDGLDIILREVKIKNQDGSRLEFSDAAIQIIIYAMHNHLNDINVQKMGCNALCLLSKSQNENRKVISKIEGHATIIKAMQKYKHNLDFQTLGIEALTWMDINDTIKEDGIGMITLAMEEHNYDANIQEKGCSAITHFAKKNIGEASAAGRVILSAMKNYSSHISVQKEALEAMKVIIEGNHENKNSILEADGVVVILSTISIHTENKEIKEACCEILRIFARLGSQRRDTIISAVLKDIRYNPDLPMNGHIRVLATITSNDWASLQRVIQAVLEYVVDDFDDVVVQRTGCQLIAGLTWELSNAKSALIKANAIPVLQEALRRHPTDASIQRNVNDAIIRLE